MDGILIGLLLATALAVNVPLGAWRRSLRRFSPAWFLAIHASIPLLLGMRLALVEAEWVTPAEIAMAIVGQMLGSRLPGLLPRAATAPERAALGRPTSG